MSYYSTISGGYSNSIGYSSSHDSQAEYSTIGGGYDNSIAPYIDDNCEYSTISGGRHNNIQRDCQYCSIGGGYYNAIGPNSGNSSDYSVIVGGRQNIISGTSPYAVISGGIWNEATNDYAVVCGGYNNESGYAASVGGGMSNTASGSYSTVPGGIQNTASGSYSLAAGWSAVADDNYSFVWSDGNQTCYSDSSRQYKVCALESRFTGTVLAADFDYLSPYPENVETAYEAVMSMQRLPDGEYDPEDTSRQLDHESLHPFIRRVAADGQPAASIGSIIGAQNEVIKDLIARNNMLEARVARLEAVLGIK